MLSLKKITKVYKTTSLKQIALDKVSVNFRKSEFASILGHSGSGKTTLLNIIGGLDKYTSGDLVINSISTKNYKDKDWDTYRNHRVGFVFQNYNLISHQSILSNVELALTLSGVSKKERQKRAKKALESVGLAKHIKKKPTELSGGQMQRVAIARALVNDPDIILADEPTGALDSETSIQIMNLLKEVSKDKLVIMVTHNPDIAKEYSTRIIKLKDGKITDDSNPYDGKELEEYKKENNKKTSMSIKTALGLSLNNLMTKKGRTILTSFAGSIGIIGIALILSLSNGIHNYIDKMEEETLSSYPLNIEKESIDMSAMLNTLTGSAKKEEYNDNKIHSVNIMGDMFTTMSQKITSNDMESFKKYLDNNKEIKKYTTDIKYTYDISMNLYKYDQDKITRVNPTTIFDAIGMETSGISSAYSGYMSNYNVFYEMLDNDKLNRQQYDLVDGRWPTKYNEVILQVDKDNRISDYTLYSLGILDQEYLKEQFNNMTTGKEVVFENTSYNTNDLIGMKFKLVLDSEYYKKVNGIWINMSEDKEYMKTILNNAEDIEIVGIIKPNDEAVVGSSSGAGMVGYTHELVEKIIEKTNNQEIVKEQTTNPNINIFTGKEFSDNNNFDMNNMTKEEMLYFQNLSQAELAEYMKSYSENIKATYEDNLKKLGISNKKDPDGISIYPKDFDSKEEITKIIDNYNKGKNENEKITYTDLVGVMMKSVSSIVDVITSVLIAFVAISLVVSSIMIAIITYISVIERTKEIGVLRAIGASKKDISRVFNAETLIEGLTAGVLGILVTLLLCIPINIIVKHIVNVSSIAKLPLYGAIILIIISIVLTVIAGLIPSKMASKKDPVEALRSE